MKGKYLITTDNWFFCPDGKQYKAVWGDVEILDDSILGIKTNRNSSNWFLKIGKNDKEVYVAGCQIHYSVKCNVRPNTDCVEEYTTNDEGIKFYERPTNIWIAE